MTPFVDQQGRVFGRLNLVDALAVIFGLMLVLAIYSSWAVFRPSTPRITTVEPSQVTSAELKIAAGEPIRLKVKVRGTGLTPLLRAYVGDVPAMGFTFEGPTSGDVIIGRNVPPGSHDLVLYDGGREVARAPKAVTIEATGRTVVRVIGYITSPDRDVAVGLQEGARFVVGERPAAEIVALGEVTRELPRVETANGVVAALGPELWAREAIAQVLCDPDSASGKCLVSGIDFSRPAPFDFDVPGSQPSLHMRVHAIAPAQGMQMATVRVRLPHSAEVTRLTVGERDPRCPSIDESAAVITRVLKTGRSIDAIVRLGVHSVDGVWRYHGEPVMVGESFAVQANNYGIAGEVVEVIVEES